MVAIYFALVCLYFLFGYLFLPDAICGTGFYFLGAVLFPFGVFLIVVVLVQKGIIKSAPASDNPPPEPETSCPEHSLDATLHTAQATPVPPSPADILCSVDSMSGYDFELWCADLLRRLGFHGVSITKASGDQGVDILAEKGGVRYAIQCKCYSSDLGNHPVQEVHAGKSMYNCHVGVVMSNRCFTAGAKELAQSTGTLLWDRYALLSMLESLEQK